MKSPKRDSTTANFEKLVALKPDVVFLYGLTGKNAVTDKLHELGLKTVYIGDYVENNPLGRAEWITVFGEFTGRRELARTLFDSISNEYNRAKALVSGVEKRPEVMLNAPWQDSWFVPGDRSYMVRLLEDAGGNYACRGVVRTKAVRSAPKRLSSPLHNPISGLVRVPRPHWRN